VISISKGSAAGRSPPIRRRAITSDAGGYCCGRWKPRPVFSGDLPLASPTTAIPNWSNTPLANSLPSGCFALALGYEDLNDHDALRHDPLLAVLVGKSDPAGQNRRCPRDRGKSLAGKSTLNRLELTPVGADAKNRYKKVVARHHDLESFFVETFLALHRQPA